MFPGFFVPSVYTRSCHGGDIMFTAVRSSHRFRLDTTQTQPVCSKLQNFCGLQENAYVGSKDDKMFIKTDLANSA